MLQEGIALVGVAMLLHSRKVKAANTPETEAPSEDAPAPPSSRAPTPSLDAAVLQNELLLGPYPLGYNLQPGQIPPWQTGGFGAGSVPPAIGGQWTPQMYQAASGTLGQALGLIPKAIRQKVSNVKRVVSFHRRLFHKIFG